MRSRFKDLNAATHDEATLVDYNEFVNSVRSYCPSVFPKAPVFYLGNLENDPENSNESSHRKLRMQLRMIFIKSLNQQNRKNESPSNSRLDVAQFFRSLIDNDFQLFGA